MCGCPIGLSFFSKEFKRWKGFVMCAVFNAAVPCGSSMPRRFYLSRTLNSFGGNEKAITQDMAIEMCFFMKDKSPVLD